MNVHFVRNGSSLDSVPAAETVVVMPFNNAALAERAASLLASRAGVGDALVLGMEDVAGEGFIALANRAFRATGSRYFGYLAQDVFPGRQWLSIALDALRGGEKHLFGFNDGKWMGVLAGFGLAARAWAKGNYAGEFFHPGYRSHYADAELTVLAMSGRVYAYNANAVLVEVDWDKDSKGVNPVDRGLYRDRAKAGFDGRVSDPRLLKLLS